MLIQINWLLYIQAVSYVAEHSHSKLLSQEGGPPPQKNCITNICNSSSSPCNSQDEWHISNCCEYNSFLYHSCVIFQPSGKNPEIFRLQTVLDITFATRALLISGSSLDSLYVKSIKGLAHRHNSSCVDAELIGMEMDTYDISEQKLWVF